MKYPLEILSLLSPSGYDRKFHENCRITQTYEEAYDLTETEYESHFGKKRYSNYESYRITKNKRMKKHKMNNGI